MEKEKTRTELDLLKLQLNPHFFFNTLNNLYALSLQQSPKTPESILQLSELMRYVIYKGQQPLVRIEEEVRYLTDYLHLQQLRLRKNLDLQFEKNKIESQQTLAPLLLIVLLENAFKHGIEVSEDAAFLRLELSCENERLYFRCENSFEPQPSNESGIGLSNLKRRLLLLYPEKHRLDTFIKNNTFTAVLELDLS
ncbi:sensor histidine kinase [Dyadobacter sp. CY356]|uniref:sensor histidine kinase n=1 Tax=Dyadobacter sp. CY356 TaxID=2906442 RepID=UPI001F27A51C|nr:sensor histidine kinase [Dyadobacter sp. CY356]MCF0055119.1 sensor histidine kinase [Dyadobacter sp. CY356]